MGAGWSKESYGNYKKMQNYEEKVELYDQENYLLFQSVGNLKTASREDGTQYVINRVYNEEYEGYFDEH